jgi:short-subunit dehydrogenase
MKIACQGGLAVITGAAGGLGSAFANQLAERGYRLLLVDRRPQPLEQLCESIAARYSVCVEPYVVDLCQRNELQRLTVRLEETPDVDLLVNNAGFGSLEYFVDADAKSLLDMVDVHVAAPVALTRAVLPRMVERNCGAIVNLSSVSGFLPSAGNVPYGSTKSFLAFFSLTLDQELRGSNVRVQVLCPGFVRTEFHNAVGMKGFTLKRVTSERLWMSADEVVRCSLRSLSRKQVIVIPGLGYSIFGRLAQMPMLRPLMQWMTHVPRLLPSAPQAVSPGAVPELTPSPAQTVEFCPEPAFAVAAELSESVTA